MTDEQKNDKFLEIKKEFDNLQKMYSEDATQKSFNCLILGEMGTGKTHLLQTARRPIHIDSFDPGGTKHLAKGISEGWIFVDTRFEKEDPLKPSTADLWKKEMDRRVNMGYFDHIGTYALDSMTMWNEAIMNDVLRKAGIAGQTPRFTHDFSPAKNQIKNYIQLLVRLPCDVVVTGHIRPDKDEVVGSVSMRVVTIGNLDTLIPSLFDEVYVTQIRDGGKGPEYSILTAPKGHYRHVRTRMGSGKFEQVEKPDIRELLKKAGRDNADRRVEAT